MADFYSFNIETGEIFIRALPGEDLSGWFVASYQQSGNSAAPVDFEPVDTSMPYGTDPDDGFVYYLQVLGPLSSPSGQRDAIVLVDDTPSVADVVGWGKDDEFDLIGGPGDGITIDPDNGNYAPGDGPWYTDGPPWGTSPPPTDLQPLPPPCFVSGSLIDTPRGAIAVEHLQVEQRVSTLDGDRTIRWIGSSRIRLNDAETTHLRPVRFLANSLGDGQPRKEVLLSQQHRLFIANAKNELLFGAAGVFVAAKHLVNGRDIFVDRTLDEVTYFHLLLDGHYVVCSSGLYAETLLYSDWVASYSAMKALAEFREVFPVGMRNTPKTNYCVAHPVLTKREARLICK